MILIKIIVISLFCYGIHIASEPGMLLSSIAEWFEKKLPVFWYKPLFGCVYCMASVWGTAGYVLISIHLGSFGLCEWLLCVVCCIAANKYLYVNLE